MYNLANKDIQEKLYILNVSQSLRSRKIKRKFKYQSLEASSDRYKYDNFL